MQIILDAAKMVAINFAEWLSANDWRKRLATHPNKVGLYWSDTFCEYKSIEELCDLFILEERKRIDEKGKENKAE
jgi:hypothetical protein